MSGFLLDTNILSELVRHRPDPRVVDFVASLDEAYLSVVTIHELGFGIARLPNGRRRQALQASVEALIAGYGDQILSVDPGIARIAGQMRAERAVDGHVMHLADALIGASARHHRLALATRNLKDFAGCGLELINPWRD